MSWRDRLLDGSFRGVAFLIDEHRETFGRRNKSFEYPFRDDPSNQDLGRRAEKWSVECFVVGVDYDRDRDALRTALKAFGPGTLVHPYIGRIQAQVDTVDLVESIREGGMARFTIQFVEPGPVTTPAITIDTPTLASNSADALDGAVQAQLPGLMSINAQPSFVTSAAVSVLGGAQTAIRTLLNSAGAVGTGVFAAVAGIEALGSNALALLAAPATLAAQLQGAVSEICDLAPFGDQAFDALSTTMSFGAALPPVLGTTPSRLQQADNQAAIVLATQCAAAAGAVRILTQLDFDSYDEAAAYRSQMSEQLDALADAASAAGSDALWTAVESMRLSMVQDLTARGASLARLYAYTPAKTEPALVIAYRLYGDASQADEIVARNAIPHPGFVQGGQAIEVLSNV